MNDHRTTHAGRNSLLGTGALARGREQRHVTFCWVSARGGSERCRDRAGTTFEGLVAELAVVLLGQQLSFTPDHINNHAACIGSWLKALRGGKRFVFRAATDTQRAVDLLVDAAAKGAAVPGGSRTPWR